MRIGIDGGCWGNPRGYGRFTRELVRAMSRLDRDHTYSLFLDPFTTREAVPPTVKIVTVSTRESPARAASAESYRTPRDLLAFSRAMAAAPLDVIFFPSVYTFVPVLRRVPMVVGVHDVIAERFPRHTFRDGRARLFWHLKVRLAVWQATLVLTVSEHARRGVQEFYRLPQEKTRSTNEAPASAFRPIRDREAVRAAFDRFGLAPDARAVMYFGGISPHKNTQMLVRVFGELIQDPRYADVKLLISGDYRREVFYSAYPALRAEVEATCRESVILTGYVDDETAAQLLNGAQVCVLPSLDEGFGLPGIEAAACGTPLIATRSSAMPETLGDAAIFFDPTNQTELREALERVLQDEALRKAMGERGLQRARELTWESAAEKVIRVFEELA